LLDRALGGDAGRGALSDGIRRRADGQFDEAGRGLLGTLGDDFRALSLKLRALGGYDRAFGLMNRALGNGTGYWT